MRLSHSKRDAVPQSARVIEDNHYRAGHRQGEGGVSPGVIPPSPGSLPFSGRFPPLAHRWTWSPGLGH